MITYKEKAANAVKQKGEIKMLTLEELKSKKAKGKNAEMLRQIWNNAGMTLQNKSEKGRSIMAQMNMREVEQAESKLLEEIQKAQEALAEVQSIKELYESFIEK